MEPEATVRDASTAPVSSDVPSVEYEVELLLPRSEAKLVETFRQEIRLCETDTQKFGKCIQKRDELLEENDGFILRLTAFENVMSVECTSYRGRKERARPLATPPGRIVTGDGAAKWDRFVGAAAVGSDAISKLLPPLKMVSLQWGKDFVQHYQLAGKGQNYCNKFSAAVKLHTLENGVRKLNQLLLRRFQIPGRRGVRAGVNPIEPVDLQNLATWRDEAPFIKDGDPSEVQLPFVDLTSKDLPPGFIFDRFGLLVRRPFEPLAGADPVDSDTVTGEIIDTTPVDTESSKLSTNKNDKDTSTTEPLNNIDLTSPRTHRLSTPLKRLLNGHASGSATESCNDGSPQPNINTTAAARLRPQKEKPDYYEVPPRNSKPTIRQTRLPNPIKLPKERCCPPQIPPSLLATLDKSDVHGVRRLLTFTPPHIRFQDMCHAHLKKFAEIATNAEPFERPLEAKEGFRMFSPDEGSHLRRRRTSLPDILDNTPLKRLRLNDPAPIQNSLPTALNQGCCPTQDPIRDEAYRQRVLEEFQSAEDGLDSWGRRTNDLVAQILQKSKPPIRGEAYFLNGEGAFQQAELGRVDIPIFTQSQQPFQWRGKDRPVSQFFNRMEDIGLNRTVSVQIPSHPLHKASCERKTLLDVRDRFLLQRLTNNPWNLLDLQSPIPSALPSFLEGENCQLLLRIRDAVLMGNSAERIAAPAQDWNTWRNVTDWALLSEGGHNTAPHMDSHGYSTWITVQEGRVGFGWMSRPRQQEEEAWMSDPHNFTGGDWRYFVLSPGHTVFFPSGTIHFVFRVQGEQTFALGGHILQWSGVGRWLEVVVAQMKTPEITNEDMQPSSSKYVCIVKELLENRIRAGRAGGAGDRDTTAKFFSLLKVS
ncbi:hypothetical protein B0T26DRAFT_763683 [Lasiosphaeria miniovina]|uniref:JmjC domain-containing protein n=1 Tax=Lasiosphaeria miniovina TaxID=1954250 RepID=A0AA40DIE8_9PEZI|nr:uncharacterized protein B0T26DRAFT_763683 [Lasiosphaeria miniovina]KAK0701088.1 hypothetical protein B0T26DRAFT_763683 [Lasiosphaeria miniovina]